MGLTDRLRQLDNHSAVSREFRVYTVQGAVLSLMTMALIGYLVVTEVVFNFQVTLQETVHVNATSPRGLEMEFDITLPQVPCHRLNIDANDPTGQSQSLHLDKQHHVWKHRIHYDEVTGAQRFLGDRTKLELGSTLLAEEDLLVRLEEKHGKELQQKAGNATNETTAAEEEEEEEDSCGSCYGAGEEGECCDTCDDVKRAYKRRGWVLSSTKDINQCKKEVAQQEAAEQEAAEKEGCNVHGIVALDSGGGNLHLAPGRDTAGGGLGGGGLGGVTDISTLFDLLVQSFTQWNVSHTLHKVRFGKDFPSAVHQLDGESRTIVDTYGMYQYYIQVVPTVYRYLNGTVISTNQYSVTEHLRHVNPGSSRGLPGVFFFYELSPLHVEIREVYRKGWIAFFTSVCAIVGGVVTVMGMVDQYLFRTKAQQGTLAR